MEKEVGNSDFENVKTFNRTFGIPTFEQPQYGIFTKDPKLVKLRMALIREELQELEEAVETHDLVETLDALVDIIYVVQGMGSSLGLDLDKAFDIVHKSNMSKACKTVDEAEKSVRFYKDRPELGYDEPAYRKSTNGLYYIIYNASSNKILKNINYTPASFKKILDYDKCSKISETTINQTRI